MSASKSSCGMSEYPAFPVQLTSRSDRSDNTCTQLTTRLIGGVSLFIGLLLVLISVIIFSTPCCGDHWEYDEALYKDGGECSTGTGAEGFLGTDNSSSSCYYRNISALISGLFAIMLLGVGFTVVCIGECLFDVNEEKEEEKLESYIRALKGQDMERRRDDALRKKIEKENRIEMSSVSDRERTVRLDIGRRYSIGNAQTPSVRHVDAYYTQENRPQVVHSHPYVYGNSKPYAVI